jgi:probable F420-dependent oxidoreductase
MNLDPGLLGAHLREHEVTPESAAEVERAGYGTLWLDGSPPADLAFAERLLDATTRLVVGTSVVNVWTAEAETVAASYHRIVAKHPGRFLLGVGIGHREVHAEYASPYGTLVSYLDALADAGVPAGRIVVAALGPKMLRLAGDRTAGTVPCLVTPDHTRRARAVLGAGKLVLPGHFALIEPDPARARGASPTTRATSVAWASPTTTSPARAAIASSTRSSRTATRPPSRRGCWPTGPRARTTSASTPSATTRSRRCARSPKRCSPIAGTRLILPPV